MEKKDLAQAAISQLNLSEISSSELERLLEEKRKQENTERLKRREAYESIKDDVVKRIQGRVIKATEIVKELFDFVSEETSAFYDVMAEYGQLRYDSQMSFTISSGNFKVVRKTNKVKRFDERADIAAIRLIEFLQEWIKNSSKGVDDPMYQLAMTLLERNKNGDLDYKSVSKLYDLEDQFNHPEYSEIMRLFKESNIVEGTAVNFYFYERTKMGVWRKVEPSFNRL